MEATSSGVFIECEIVSEREKAIEIQHWFGSGSDPRTSARCKWVPRSCVVAYHRSGVSLKKWFVTKERLWDWAN